MHRLGCWKERLLYSVPALVCAISLMSFCVYLIAAVFFSIHLLHSKRRGRGVQKNIVLIVVRRVNEFERLCFIFLRECVCERNASAPHGAFLVCRVGFFAFVFFVWLDTNYWQREFWWSGAHGDSTMHVTASRNHSGQTNSSQPLASAGSYTEVTSLTFIHGRPLNTVVL